jgi:hypothetical protein
LGWSYMFHKWSDERRLAQLNVAEAKKLIVSEAQLLQGFSDFVRSYHSAAETALDAKLLRLLTVELASTASLPRGLADLRASGLSTETVEGDISELVERVLEQALRSGHDAAQVHRVRAAFAHFLRAQVLGEADEMFAGSIGSLLSTARASEGLQIAVRYMPGYADETTSIIAKVRLMLDRPASKDPASAELRNVVVVYDVKVKESLDNAFGNRITVLLGQDAGTLSQLLATLSKPRGAGQNAVLSPDEMKRAVFRFLLPRGLDMSGFIDTENIDPARFLFFMLINDALNAVAVQIQSQRLSDLDKFWKQLSIQA